MKLKFSPQAAFRVYDEFPDNVTEDSDGALYVSVNLPEGEVMFSYLLSFGASVEIIEPEYIRTQMKEKLNLMLNKYKI